MTAFLCITLVIFLIIAYIFVTEIIQSIRWGGTVDALAIVIGVAAITMLVWNAVLLMGILNFAHINVSINVST